MVPVQEIDDLARKICAALGTHPDDLVWERDGSRTVGDEPIMGECGDAVQVPAWVNFRAHAELTLATRIALDITTTET